MNTTYVLILKAVFALPGDVPNHNYMNRIGIKPFS